MGAAAVVGVFVAAALLRPDSIAELVAAGGRSHDAFALGAISLSNPTDEERDILERCLVLRYVDQVEGMAKVPHASELPRYVSLTGREPEIHSEEPAWVVDYRGELMLALRGGNDPRVSDPLCVVIGSDEYWFVEVLPTTPLEPPPTLAP